MILPLLWKFKGPIAIILVISGIVGYIWYLRSDIKKYQNIVEIQDNNIRTLKSDVETAKSAIEALNSGSEDYQTRVNDSVNSVKKTIGKIVVQNSNLQRALDNVSIFASKARRIEDAPTIPFFIPVPIPPIDNGVRP